MLDNKQLDFLGKLKPSAEKTYNGMVLVLQQQFVDKHWNKNI